MKNDLYSELFEYSAFPVFAFSFSGIILYKNNAANKYLPMLRKNACARKHFYPAEIPEKSGVLRIVGDTPYRIALALKDENGFLCFCFSRFQYDDGIQTAKTLLHRFGDTATAFLIAFQKATVSAPIPQTERIYTDIFSTVEEKALLSGEREYSFENAVTLLFEKLNVSFGALGYRVCTQISADFLSQKNVHFSLQDFLFLFSRLLYLQMRLSENGDVSVLLTSNDKEHIFRFCIRTETPISLPSEKSIAAFLSDIVPECAPEFTLLEKAGLLNENHLHLYPAPFGYFTAEYRVPYRQNAVSSVKSISCSYPFLTENIDLLLLSVEKLLINNGASC